MTALDWTLAIIGAPALGLFLDGSLELLGVPLSEGLTLFSEVISSASPAQLCLLALALSLGPGLGEELLFRGYIQTRLTERYGVMSGVVLSSLLFGALHLDPLHSTLAAIVGLYLGSLVVRSGDIRAGIAAHAFNNLFATLSPLASPPRGEAPAWTAFTTVLGFVVLVAISRRLFCVPPADRRDSAIFQEPPAP